ncbi:ADP-ribose glycohydrolase OARD1-like [Acyrthosiphon pisum]|uniref:Macro domain-containing protein n=1 Tax=Acyrthosiphon pisum TaxID=7029 RepID=A0A8R2NXQ2_ACYPI|nr:ADP-ribose glycohydrolase OARD1-like [Acyrthosiphon pisum]
MLPPNEASHRQRTSPPRHLHRSLNQDTLEDINGELLNMPEEYSLGHCVAKDMRMSAGIAVYFKRKFGRVGELMDQRPNVGSVAYLQENDRFIYYLITKELSNQKPTYNCITAAITKLRDLIVEHGVKKLAIPRIGCGLDKLDWSIMYWHGGVNGRNNHKAVDRQHGLVGDGRMACKRSNNII